MWWRVWVCILLLCMMFVGVGTTNAAEDSSAQSYWNDFRRAILDGKTEKVASMTRFPLWVRGPDDSDPVIYYNRDKFPKILKRLLNQEILYLQNGRVKSKTMLQAIREKQKLTADNFLPGDLVEVEQFEFERVDGRWWLVRAFLEE